MDLSGQPIQKEFDCFATRVRRALTLPIRTRCAELTVLLDRATSSELQGFFPILVDNIFGPQGTTCWGLRCFRECNEDFQQIQYFLSPCGPMFKMIYVLLKDLSAKYEFPIMYLPAKVQQLLENSSTHPFYSDLVYSNPQTRQISSLLLNPFDYYMFHFAYHLINPWHQRNGSLVATWNTVYFCLCCDYILHFLSTKPGDTILPHIYYSGKNPIYQASPIRSAVGPQLLNLNRFEKPGEEYNNYQTVLGRHPKSEIWRSETVLNVFVDLWLYNNQISQNYAQMNSSFNSSQVPRLLQFNELPNSEYMRAVRVLTKQLHAFAASAKMDDTRLSELKRIAVLMVQGKFYVFLRNVIHRWPLDGSFRLLLELWLTYIQPWRYVPNFNEQPDFKKLVDQDEQLITTSMVDRDYLPFLADNLLVYVVIFQQLLPRFIRVDLVSPKMAVMLFRISKVFSQPNLVELLKEVEKCAENNNSPTHTYNNYWHHNLPPLNATANWSSNTSSWNVDTSTTMRHLNTSANSPSKFGDFLYGDKKWSAIVRQRIYELEGPSFCYKALFVSPAAPEVCELILHIKRSIEVAHELAQTKQREEDELYNGFFGLFKAFWSPIRSNDEFSLQERLKVPEYLQKSLDNLQQIFEVGKLLEVDSDSFTSSGSEIANDFRFLTPAKVRERVKHIKYEGDPDLHPVRSTEVTFLVRMLYQLAVHINEKYESNFCRLYYEPSYWGRLSRQILSPPITIYRYDKLQPGSPRVSRDLQPRLSLRPFASYKLIFNFFIGALIAMFVFGYSFSAYCFVLLFCYLLYKCCKAVPKDSVRYNYPTQGFNNISFNDSF